MKKNFLFALLLLPALIFAQKNKSSTDKRFAGLDTAFERVLKDWHAAGFSVAVVEKNKVVYEKGFGYSNMVNKTQATAQTQYAIGSCTKAFTASLIGQLMSDNSVDIDKPVRNYLPELNFYNDEMNDHITLRDMMCHRTGLPRYDYSWYFFPSDSRDSVMQRIKYMEPSAGLREEWQYNNYMFMLQGMVTEKLTGKTWEQNIYEKIFKPLGMDSASLSIEGMLKHADVATGYGVEKDSIIKQLDYYHITSMAPAGSINSSVDDMSKWLITWINGGLYNGKQIIPPAYLSQAISMQMVMGAALPSADKPDLYFSGYGFGWMLSSYRGHYRVEHGGNIDGFSASTCFFPSDSIGIVVLCNQNGSSVPAVVRNIIADRMLGLKYFDWETDLKSATDKALAAAKMAEGSVASAKVANAPASHPLKDFEGLYQNKAYGNIEVVLQNDSLFALLGTHTWWLGHYHYDMFQPFDRAKDGTVDTSENGPAQLLQFKMDAAGNIESFTFPFEPAISHPIEFSRIEKPKPLSEDQLQEYVASYALGGIDLKIYIKNKELYLFVPGQPEYELVPVDKDKFAFKTLKGFNVVFKRDDNGSINELWSVQPNGTFKAKRKTDAK